MTLRCLGVRVSLTAGNGNERTTRTGRQRKDPRGTNTMTRRSASSQIGSSNETSSARSCRCRAVSVDRSSAVSQVTAPLRGDLHCQRWTGRHRCPWLPAACQPLETGMRRTTKTGWQRKDPRGTNTMTRPSAACSRLPDASQQAAAPR